MKEINNKIDDKAGGPIPSGNSSINKIKANIKTKVLKAQLFFAFAFLVFIVIGCFSNSEAVAKADPFGGLKIQYLKPIHLNISSNGINRLNFGDDRIVKIVGDSSEYSVILSDNGSDLFLTSKLAPLKIIDLTLITAHQQSIDLRLHVNNSPNSSIININLAGKNQAEIKEREEVMAMINAMNSNSRGKYFIEERKRLIKMPNRPDLTLNQYVSYRYGDLMGAGFTFSNNTASRIFTRKNHSSQLIQGLTKEDLRGVFKDIIAISVNSQNKQGDEKGRVFVIFKAGEEMDV